MAHPAFPAEPADLADDEALAIRVERAWTDGQADLIQSWRQLESHSQALRAAAIPARLTALNRENAPSFSPWHILSYHRIVRHLAAGGDPETLPITPGALVDELDRAPAAGTVLAFADTEAVPPEPWQALLELFQAGGDFLPDLEPPSGSDIRRMRTAIAEVRELLRLVDGTLATLMDRLQPLLILAGPGPVSRGQGLNFGGATTFFFRGGSAINGVLPHTPATLLEVLVHEYAHAELFTLAQAQLLCRNSDDERHSVRIRRDARPMNGILHGLHVSSRVAGLCTRLLQHGLAGRSDRAGLLSGIEEQRHHARLNGLSCLEAAKKYGALTPLGREVMRAAAIRLGASADGSAAGLSPPA